MVLRLAGPALLALACLCGMAEADSPLPAPTDWRYDLQGVSVMADTTAGQVTIAPVGAPAWQIDGWLPRWAVHPSPDGGTVLLSNSGGNLLAGSAPDRIVLRIVQAPGLLRAVVPLSSLADPARLQRTTSHVVWISGGYHWQEGGWAFTSPDGQDWHLSVEGRLTRR